MCHIITNLARVGRRVLGRAAEPHERRLRLGGYFRVVKGPDPYPTCHLYTSVACVSAAAPRAASAHARFSAAQSARL